MRVLLSKPYGILRWDYNLVHDRVWRILNDKLKKGDILFIKDLGNKLELATESKEVKEKKEITITVDKKEINSLRREMISAYINNYNEFVFIGESLSKKLEDIRNMTRAEYQRRMITFWIVGVILIKLVV